MKHGIVFMLVFVTNRSPHSEPVKFLLSHIQITRLILWFIVEWMLIRCFSSATHSVWNMSHLWLAITLTYMSGFWYFFGTNTTSKVSNQKMLYYATSNNLYFCTTWQNRNHKTQKLDFSLTVLVHCQNSTSCCLNSSIFLTQDLYSDCYMTL